MGCALLLAEIPQGTTTIYFFGRKEPTIEQNVSDTSKTKLFMFFILWYHQEHPNFTPPHPSPTFHMNCEGILIFLMTAYIQSTRINCHRVKYTESVIQQYWVCHTIGYIFHVDWWEIFIVCTTTIYILTWLSIVCIHIYNIILGF